MFAPEKDIKTVKIIRNNFPQIIVNMVHLQFLLLFLTSSFYDRKLLLKKQSILTLKAHIMLITTLRKLALYLAGSTNKLT